MAQWSLVLLARLCLRFKILSKENPTVLGVSSPGVVARLPYLVRMNCHSSIGAGANFSTAAMGGTYEFTRFASANLRERDDSLNTALGGFLAGSVLGLKGMLCIIRTISTVLTFLQSAQPQRFLGMELWQPSYWVPSTTLVELSRGTTKTQM